MTTYNVLINSNNRIVGTRTSSARYYFDWGAVMEQGEYFLSWGFVSSNIDATINTLGLVSINLGQSTVYSATGTNIRASTTNIIGTVIPNENATSSYLFGDRDTNGIIRLNRPNSNEFTVGITLIDGSIWADSNGTELQEYLLALNFEKI